MITNCASIRGIIYIAITAMMLVTCRDQNQQSIRSLPQEKAVDSVMTILEKIYQIWSDGAMTNLDIYANGQFLSLSGGETINWIENTNTRHHGAVNGLDRILASHKSGELTIPAINMFFDVVINDSKRATSVIYLSLPLPPSDVGFDTIQHIFGAGWRTIPTLPPPGIIRTIPSHPLGNSTIEYRRDDDRFTGSIRIELSFNGSLHNITFNLEKR